MDIPMDITNKSRYTQQQMLQEKAKQMLKGKLEESAKGKSKMCFYFEGKHNWNIGKRSTYMNKLTRNQASIIFRSRTRMLKVKSNYKNGNQTLNCDLCKIAEETQHHILEECTQLINIAPKVTKEMIFNEDPELLKTTAMNIKKRMEFLKNPTSTNQ